MLQFVCFTIRMCVCVFGLHVYILGLACGKVGWGQMFEIRSKEYRSWFMCGMVETLQKCSIVTGILLYLQR